MLGGGGAIGDRDLERLSRRLSDDERECERRAPFRDESRSLLRFLDPMVVDWFTKS